MSARLSFFAELKRRNVYKVGAMYAVAGWLLVQIVTQVFPIFDISAFVQRLIVLAIVAGFPVALVLSWIYELTPQGIVKTDEVDAGASITPQTGQRLNRAIIGVLSLAVLVLLAQLLWPRLHADSTESSAAADRSIAVLPFANLSSDADNAYFADGIQDEVLTRLAKVGALKVISRTSTLQYATRPTRLKEIGEQLGVANIVEGSVQKSGNSVRINVQLIRAATDEHLWAERYDRKLDDVFGVQGEVAAAIADALKARLSPTEQREIAAQSTRNAEAYQAYLRGLSFSRRADDFRRNTQQAIAHFSEAVRLDPEFAAAWAMLSQTYGYAYWNFDPSDANRQAARDARDAAVRLDPQSLETVKTQGLYVYWIERDYANARRIFERIRAQQPNDNIATLALAAIARRQGRWADSLALWQQAIDLDPRNMFCITDATSTAVSVRDIATAQRWVEQGMAIEPRNTGLVAVRVALLQLRGETDEAQAALDSVSIATGDDMLVFAAVYNALLQRRYQAAADLLTEQLGKPAELGTSGPSYQATLADLLVRLGKPEQARALFERAREAAIAAWREQPDNPGFATTLSFIEAGLGHRQEALDLVRAAAELLPPSRDAYVGPTIEEQLVRLQVRFGDYDAAIAGLRHLLSISYGGPPLTAATLKLDPDFDALRGDPRFQALVAGAVTQP